MIQYLVRRVGYMLVTLLGISIIAFVVIQAPPGDYLDIYIQQLRARGIETDREELAGLENRYGLNQPVLVQYFKWMGNLITLDLGKSFATRQKVTDMLAERVPLTALITLLTTLFTFAMAIPIGIYSATHQYSLTDYTVTTIGFIGLATPNFLLALILMFLFSRWFGVTIGGLFSPEMVTQPFSLAKLWDLITHLPVPIVVVGTAGTAALIRIMRATMLDELRKQYVITARSKGVNERALLFKYPVRIAVNPLVSTIGWLLPEIISGATVTGIVLSLPTTGPLLLTALLQQDMYLAGSIIVVLSLLTVIGTLISDLLLVLIDPRIRMERSAAA